MNPYRHFIIPLVQQAEACFADCSTPLEEELWLISRAGSNIDWESISVRCRTTYGLNFLYNENDLINAHNLLPETTSPPGFRLFTSKKNGQNYFVMEHPSLVTVFDRIGEPDQEPVLAKPSLFSHWYGHLAGANNPESLTSETGGETDDESSIEVFIHFIKELARSKPSDWHLEPRKSSYLSRLRRIGQMTDVSEFSARHGRWLTNSLMTISGIEGNAPNTPLDSAFTIPGENGQKLSIRVSMVPSLYGYSIVCRFLYPDQNLSLSLENLGIKPNQESLINKAYKEGEGLWLVCGPTGSGKTTTLHCLLNTSINANMKVLAVEDPVERIIPGVQQVQVNQARGITFAASLRSFLRQAPETILIGEIRDPETAAIVLQASFTGHRVLASIHARSHTGVLHRFEDLQQDYESAKTAIRMVIHQRLIPTLCECCKTSVSIPEDLSQQIMTRTGVDTKCLSAAIGCSSCTEGYSGRTGIFCVSDLISNGNTENILQNEAMHLLLSGKTSLQGAISFLPEAFIPYFRFHNCKDFANYQLKHTR